MTPLLLAVDVDYRDNHAIAAGVWFRGWDATSADLESTIRVEGVADYIPGEFYRRELPCLQAIIAEGPRPSVIIVDGYVWLGPLRPGLGAKLFSALQEQIPVVGVAKTCFHSAQAYEVRRGQSTVPLWVTAIGIDPAEAAEDVQRMAGAYRLPDMLKRVDSLARTAEREAVNFTPIRHLDS